ncbi:MAG: T9SS type A sorting domain-containing protein [Chitinophagaceae bacterium]|nr:T9SS type A sorting domain-containing protein [Chitinophagaceae bacterium]
MKKLYFFFIISFLLFSSQVHAQREYQYPCGTYFISLNGTSDKGLWQGCYTSGDFTLSAWFQLRDEAWQGKEMDLFHRETYKFPNIDGFSLFIGTDGILGFRTYINKNNNSVLETISSGIKPEPFKWHHVALSFKAGGSCQLYYNGRSVASGSFEGGRFIDWNFPDFLSVGSKYINHVGGGHFATFKGYLDEVAFCEAALTQSQIDTLAAGLEAGDPFLRENKVIIYRKNDTWPNTVNSGYLGGSNGTIVGQQYQCPKDNQPPVANAGPDKEINLPLDYTTLDGSGTDPDGTISKYEWRPIRSPGGNYGMTDFSNPVVTVRNLKEGLYEFELTVTDNAGLQGYDSVLVKVKPATEELKLVNPYPAMIDDEGEIKSSVKDIDITKTINGLGTDGISKLILYIEATDGIKFTIENHDPSQGYLSPLNHPSLKNSEETVFPVAGAIALLYHAPDGYGTQHPSLTGRYVQINGVGVNDASRKYFAKIRLMPPPIVLVHGMWSNPASWDADGFSLYLKNAGYFNIHKADYEAYNHTTFDPTDPESIFGRMAVYDAINRGLKQYMESGIFSAKVDVVGHSLGGLMARSFTQTKPNFSKRNFKQGYVHKLITIGTPHSGSPFGPAVYNLGTKIRIPSPLSLSSSIAARLIVDMAVGKIGSCHRDFDPARPTHLTPTFENKIDMVHAVVASWEGGDIEQVAWFHGFSLGCYYLFGKTYSEIFNGNTNTDFIVKVKSQLGGLSLAGKGVTYVPGTAHSSPPGNVSETKNSFIFQEVNTLLHTSVKDLFEEYFPSPPFVSDRVMNEDDINKNRKIENTEPLKTSSTGNELIKIRDGSKGQILSGAIENEIEIAYDTEGGAKVDSVVCIVQNVGWFMFPVGQQNIKVKVPVLGKIGRFNFSILAKDITGVILGDTSSFVIKPAGDFVRLAVDPGYIALDSTIRQVALNPVAVYFLGNDTVRFDVKSIIHGISYQSQSGKVTIDANGIVKAQSPGQDTIVINYLQGNVKIPVTVASDFLLSIKYSSAIDFIVTDKKFSDQSFLLQSHASSSEDVRYALVSGPVSLENDLVIFLDTGTVTIRASAPGNAYFNAPPDVVRTFRVLPNLQTQTLAFDIIPTQTFGDPPVLLSAMSNSNLPVTYVVVSGPGTIKGDSLLITGAGEIVVKAIQEGNNSYAPASAEQTIVVAKANQTITIDLIPAKTFGDPPVPLSATSNSNLPVTYVVVSGPGTIKGDSLLITGAGEIVVKAVQEGNSNYTSAADEQTIIVNKAFQTLTFDPIPSQPYTQEPVILSGSSSSGLPVVYTVVSGPATVTGNSLLMTGTGTVVVQAALPGDNNYVAADTVRRTFCVTASQSAAINGDTLSCTGKSTYFINAKWGTGYQWAVSENASVKVLSDTSVEISYTRPGYYSITATPGNTCSSPANTLTVHITEGPAKPVITVVNDALLSSGAENGNQWFINGNIIPGATRHQYAPLQTGDYTVQVNVDGCTSPVSEPYHFTSIDPPSVSDTSLLEDAVKLYPNPFDHTLKVLNKRNTPIGLRLYDITGRVVLYTEIRPGVQDISTSHLQRGMYMAMLINLKEGTWARKMLLKL